MLRIQRYPALLEVHKGPPGVGTFINAFLKTRPRNLISVTGYKLTASTVLRIAGTVTTVPGRAISLPIYPGPIVSRHVALATGRASLPTPPKREMAKLTSWTEVQAVIQPMAFRSVAKPVPPTLSERPWRPIWTVLATRGHHMAHLLVIDARSGASELNVALIHPSWFAALTDRDPGLHDGCPGGSTARLPFGVPTRDEQAFTLRGRNAPNPQHLRTIVIMKLTTIPTLDRVDFALYDGCILQSCTL